MPCERKDRVDYIRVEHEYSLVRACKLINLSRSLYYYVSVKNDKDVIDKILQLSDKRPMEGQDKIWARIRSEGIIWNHKRISRVYRMLGMNKKKRTRKRLPARVKQPLLVPPGPNKTWSMDFMHDALMNGRKFRTLNIIDDYNREALRVEPFFSIGSALVIKVLGRLILERGRPDCIRMDNGPEFIASALKDWCSDKGIVLQYIQPGRPMQNGYVERFNKSYRNYVLDAYLFEDITQVRILTDEFMDDYNNERPHQSLGDLSPVKYRLRRENQEVF